MTPEEIIIEIDQINRMLLKLSRVGNDLWEKKEELKKEYEKQTGEKI